MQDNATGFVAWAGTVNNQVSLFGKQRRIGAHGIGCDPLCARDNDGISQQIQRLANIKDENILLCGQQRLQGFRCNGVPFHFATVSHAFGQNDSQQNSSANDRYRQVWTRQNSIRPRKSQSLGG
jgi:hypothetical protein